jgi:MSHA biogenesis protein MshL
MKRAIRRLLFGYDKPLIKTKPRLACLWLVLPACLVFLDGCSTSPDEKPPRNPSRVPVQATRPPARMTSELAPLPERPAFREAKPKAGPPTGTRPVASFSEMEAQAKVPASTNRYTFSAKELEIKEALALFARSHHLNIVPDPDVTGTVTVEFQDLPLDKSMEAILGAFGYYAEIDRGLIRVRKTKTTVFTIDYIRLVRAGNGSSSANVTSGTSAGGMIGGSSGGGGGGAGPGGAGGGQDGASVTISHNDSIRFWEELETELKTLVSPEAKMAVNRMSGQILLTDSQENVERVGHYLEAIKKTLHRQVDIEARIYEVLLDDEFHLGIDWQNVNRQVQNYVLSTGGGMTGIPTSRWIVDNPIGGYTPGAPTVSLALTKGDEQVVVQALKEQGDLEVVSQPRIRTMNNQAALIKVGSDKPFFRQSSVVITGTGPSQVATDTEVQIITIGTILSITPQISDDGWITMDISPVITRLVDTVEGPDGTTAPETDIKQTSSLVRVRDNQTVVIGGLIANENAKTVRKVPLLGDIPWLGKLFQGVFTKKRKVELVIFITPTIVE